MTGEKIEVILDFSVLLLCPIIYHYYLWKHKKLSIDLIFKDIKVYFILYGLIGFGFIILLLK